MSDDAELNGHIDTAEECRDWISHHAMDNGDTSGKLFDYAQSMRFVLDALASFRMLLRDAQLQAMDRGASYQCARAEAEQLRSGLENWQRQCLDLADRRIPELHDERNAARAEAEQVRAERDAAVQQAADMAARFEKCREANAALIQTHMRVMDEKNALVLEAKQWRTTKGDASK